MPPTLKQKTAFDKTLENIGKGNPKTMGEILLESGYAPAVSENPQLVTQSKGWQELLAEIDDDKLVKNLYSIALDKKDKRASLQATDMLLDLKGKYPNQKTEVEFTETLKSLQDGK